MNIKTIQGATYVPVKLCKMASYLRRQVLKINLLIGEPNAAPGIVISLLGTCSSSSSSGAMSGGSKGPFEAISFNGFTVFFETLREIIGKEREAQTPELLFVCNDGKTIEEKKHNNHYLYIICCL